MTMTNFDGIKKSIQHRLEDISNIQIDKNLLVPKEIATEISEISSLLNREISLSIDRKGNIIDVSVGDSHMVEMAQTNYKRRGLSGVRIIHTHPNGNPNLSELDISALINLKLDCIVALGVDEGKITGVNAGFCSIKDKKIIAEITRTFSLEETQKINLIKKIQEIEGEFKELSEEEDDGERAILVGNDTEKSLDELKELAKACNVNVIQKVFQSRSKTDIAFYIGKGKVEEVASLKQALNCNLVIFDDELSGSQVRNLEDALGVKVIDRTTLILEIFARRAKTKEAKIQVEAAQLRYRLSRLLGLGTVLSRTGGGIGTKGPGEKKLEIDRRHIKERLYELNLELNNIKRTRAVQREKRETNKIPKVSLVGYTNVGKSTLRNKLYDLYCPKDLEKKEMVYEANMLFATLDVTIRAIKIKDGRTITLSDTVGFINKLPHDLIQSFKSTLEEVKGSDLLLHVIDVSSIEALNQINSVEEVLLELKADDKPVIFILNKIDIASEENILKIKENLKDKVYVEISAKPGYNIDALMEAITVALKNENRKVSYLFPYSCQNYVSILHNSAKIITEEYREEGTYIETEVNEELYNKYKDFQCD